MATPVGDLLREERQRRGWTLRDVERRTGIHNAHLSQIEQGAIARPAPNMLFTLSALYDLPYERLMRLAGHFEASRGQSRRSMEGAAMHALGELTRREQRSALEYMQQLIRDRARE